GGVFLCCCALASPVIEVILRCSAMILLRISWQNWTPSWLLILPAATSARNLRGHPLDIGGIAGTSLGVVDGIERKLCRRAFHASKGLVERGAWQYVPVLRLVLAQNLKVVHP